MSNLKNNRYNQKHSFHLVDPSPWPIVGSMSALMLTFGIVMAMHIYYGGNFLWRFGLVMILFTMFCWWRDSIREATYEGQHTQSVQAGLKIGVVLFIILVLFDPNVAFCISESESIKSETKDYFTGPLMFVSSIVAWHIFPGCLYVVFDFFSGSGSGGGGVLIDSAINALDIVSEPSIIESVLPNTSSIVESAVNVSPVNGDVVNHIFDVITRNDSLMHIVAGPDRDIALKSLALSLDPLLDGLSLTSNEKEMCMDSLVGAIMDVYSPDN